MSKPTLEEFRKMLMQKPFELCEECKQCKFLRGPNNKHRPCNFMYCERCKEECNYNILGICGNERVKKDKTQCEIYRNR